jgi:hypothetical protein
MRPAHPSSLQQLLSRCIGPRRSADLLAVLELPDHLPLVEAGAVHRSELALALAALLFDDVLRRVPMATAYVEELRRDQRRLCLDHGALRTVAAPSGALPGGALAFARFLEPLGYRRAGTYDLARLGMTGYAYCHSDGPEVVPQYFVSELHPERFSPAFREAVTRVVGSSREPLSASALQLLERLRAERHLPLADAAHLLPELVACFDRQHAAPRLSDYEILLAESAEMAWIATEGNAFNHATDRVEDVFATAARQRSLGRPVKDSVEVSRSGRVLQTAFRAATVERPFLGPDGAVLVRSVPGSFHEFITRHRLADGTLDLEFDAGNATSIFRMTAAEAQP